MPRSAAPRTGRSTTATPSRATARNTSAVNGGSGWARARARTRSDESRTGFEVIPMTEIEKLVERKQWAKARTAVQEELVEAPTDHWLWLTLSLTYYEQKHYDKALQSSKRPWNSTPLPPRTMALRRFALHERQSGFRPGDLDHAPRHRTWTIVAHGECSEGSRLPPTHERCSHLGGVAHIPEWKENPERACVSFEKYLHNRKHGVGSIYDRKQVEDYLAGLTAAENHTDSGTPARRAAKS